MKKYKLTKERLIWIIIIIFLIIIQIFPVFNLQGNNNKLKYINLLEEAMHNIRTIYIDQTKTSYKNLIHNAIKGMLESLNDKHSKFLNESEYKNLNKTINQQFIGLGIVVSFQEDFPKVISVIKNTPAYKSQIKKGYYIIAVEGKSTKNIKKNKFINKIKGKIGTSINIQIAKDNVIKTLKLKRAIIKTDPIESKLLENKIAYIKIKVFAKNTFSQIKKHINKLKNQGMQKIILDLRNNPGGLLNQAIKTSNIFLTKGIIVSTKGRNPKNNKKFYVSPKKNLIKKSIPIIVLVNKQTASASEILTASIKDNKRGLIIGEKTFGKGSVQSIIALHSSNENIALRLTTQEYFSPLMQKIHHKGIEPNIKINNQIKYNLEKNIENILINKNYIKNFLIKYPSYNKKNISTFHHYLSQKDIKLKRKILEHYIKKEQYKNTFKINYDNFIEKAINIFKK